MTADGGSIPLQKYFKRLVRNLTALQAQRWVGHERVHERDQVALAEALSRTDQAIKLALTSHRREHEIERVTGLEADAAHQLRHEQMNEIRSQLNDQAATFARQDVLNGSLSALNRRLDEMRGENLAYRDAIRGELLGTRDALQAEIASLRESRSEFQGGVQRANSYRQQANWSTGVLISAALALVAIIVAIVTFVVSHR